MFSFFLFTDFLFDGLYTDALGSTQGISSDHPDRSRSKLFPPIDRKRDNKSHHA